MGAPLDMAPLKALLLGTPNVIREWGARVFERLVVGTPKSRDTGSVSRINDYAIEMMCLEAEWVADLTRDAVRKNIVSGDALRMWVWGSRPRLKSQVRDNPDDAKTFSSLCRILADHLDELDTGIIEAMKPAPVGDGWVSWYEIRVISDDCLSGREWLMDDEASERIGRTVDTIVRWGPARFDGDKKREHLIAPRWRYGIRYWNTGSLYFARVMKQFWVVAGRRQNHGRDPLDLLDEVLTKMRDEALAK